MIVEMTAEQKLLELYLDNVDMVGEGFPEGVNALRRGFMEAFNLMGLPAAGDERYRHRDMGPLFAGEWEHYFTPVSFPVGNTIVDGHGITLCNGFCDPEMGLRQTAEGAVFGSLRSAANRFGEVFGKYYNSLADNDNESLAALNSAFMQDGAFVYVPAGTKVEKPFIVSCLYSSGDEAQMCFVRTLVVLEDGAKADIVFEHATVGGGRFLVDYVREVSVGEGAALGMAEVCDMDGGGALLMHNYQRQMASSDVRNTALFNRGALTAVTGAVLLDGAGCNSEIYGLYMISGTDRCDVNLRMNHNGPDSTSRQLIKGIAGGGATGSFTGRVYVAPGAQRTDAQQQSRNLLLGDGARIYTEPQLEIYADDVKCSHGATVGRMEDEAVYYMRQRGVGEDDARKLQMSGFVNEVLGRCADEDVCERMLEMAARRIEEL